MEKLDFKIGIRWLRRSGAVVLVPNVGISASVNTGEKSFGAFDIRERMSAIIVDIVDSSPIAQRFVIDVTKGFTKTVKYNDNASTTPTNCNLYVVWQATAANGVSSIGQSMAEYHVGYRVEYVDM